MKKLSQILREEGLIRNASPESDHKALTDRYWHMHLEIGRKEYALAEEVASHNYFGTYHPGYYPEDRRWLTGTANRAVVMRAKILTTALKDPALPDDLRVKIKKLKSLSLFLSKARNMHPVDHIEDMERAHQRLMGL